MKILKKILIGFGIVLVLLVAAGIILPIIFKDDIKKAIDEEIAKSVNADVIFEADNFSLSVFSNFPNITAKIEELGVFNRAPFEGTPLFVVESFEVEINLGDVLFGDQLKLKGITLVKPQISVKVLKDGTANYDITYPSTDTVQVAGEPSQFSFGIDHWRIINGDVVYDDASIPFYAGLTGLNHSGSGNFNEQQFDLTTESRVDTLNIAYDGTEYLSRQKAEINMVISISEEYSKYTFKENSAKINDFALGFDGWLKMNDAGYDMDITYKTQENAFKSLLSLVPGIYTEGFGHIETKGDLAFNGMVKGTYSDTQMPAFNLTLLVKEAMFHYPDLPTPVNNINMDLRVDNQDGVIENTLVDLRQLHLDFGSNPVDVKMKIENLRDYRMEGTIAAQLNLAELNKMFPMEGLETKGSYKVNASVKGVYDSIRHLIPALDMSMSLADGYVKSADFPVPLQDLKFSAAIKNTSGKMAETLINVNDFSMMMEGERFDANLMLQNLDDYTWDLKAKGGVDLEKITKIFPLEGITLAGKVKADIQTKGKYSDVTAGRYHLLPTSGSASATGVKYSSTDLPYAVGIKAADMAFDPKKIELKNLEGTIGKSDFKSEGIVSDYMGFVLGNGTMKGNVNFSSNFLDLNEFMTSTEEEPTEADTASYGVIVIPHNIDFILQSSVAKVKMMDFDISSVKGDVILKDGVANLSNLKFNMLGGGFALNGTYDTRDLHHPKYDMDLKIENLSIQQAAHSFSIVKQFAPVAGLVLGSFSTDFKLNGELGQDMMPKLSTVNAGGLIKIAEAALSQSKLLSGITALTKLDNTDNVSLKNVIMSAAISNGRFSVKPFDVKFGSYKTNVSGSTGLDGSLDYTLKMNVPAGKLGSQFQGFINQYAGSKNPNDEIPVTIGLGGTYNSPNPQLVLTEQKAQVKEAVTNLAEEKSKDALKDLTKGTKAEGLVKNLLGGDSTKTGDSTKAANPVQDLLKNKMQNLLKKKKKN